MSWPTRAPLADAMARWDWRGHLWQRVSFERGCPQLALALAVAVALPCAGAERALPLHLEKAFQDDPAPAFQHAARRDTLDLEKWLAVPAGVMRMLRGGKITYILTISADTPGGYNVYNVASAAGYPVASAINLTVVVNSGIYVGGTMTWTSFHSGSTLSLLNSGFVEGAGGVGTGANGGVAMFVSGTFTLSINNANGGIYGGGGGGNHGGADAQSLVNASQGGGGGGGAGYPVGTGAAPTGSGNPGTSGSDGTRTGTLGGIGGNGGHDAFYGTGGGGGGQGGGCGHDGFAGSSSSDGTGPGSPGTAGNATTTVSATLVWLSGFDATHVRGTVA